MQALKQIFTHLCDHALKVRMLKGELSLKNILVMTL